MNNKITHWIHKHLSYGLTVGLICFSASINAQQNAASLSNLINSLDSNNTTLKSYRAVIEAEKISNRVGINPDDPQVGINYLRPNPRLSDRRLDFEISQELEFPTVYGHRRKVANSKDQVLDMNYHIQRSEILSEGLEIWAQWFYYYQNKAILELQKTHAIQIAEAFQKSFNAGQINVLERNKARINQINKSKDFELNEIELQSAYNELVAKNGGKPIKDLPVVQPDWQLPNTFEEWINQSRENSVLLQTLSTELAANQAQEKLAKAMQLPNFQIGFMREQDIEVDFRGVTFGMSIPLWQHKNRNKHARLQTQAQETLLFHTTQQQEIEQRNLFLRAQTLSQQVEELKVVANESNSPELLKKALDLGEITLVDYLVEQSMYYELMEKILQAEKDYLSTQILLRKWLL